MLKDFYNEIIPPWDSRYGKIGHIRKKYKYENLMYSEDSWRFYYLIPADLVLNEYTNSVGSKCTKNPQSDWDNWIYYRDVNKILWITSRLTSVEYFNLLVLDKNDRYYRVKCKICKIPLKFHSIKAGYLSSSYANWIVGQDTCCSNSCATTLKHINGVLSESVYKLHYDASIGAFNDMNRLLNSDKEFLYFYLTWTKSGKLKYGVTENVYWRQRTSSKVDQYLNSHIIAKLPKEEAVYLEANIKLTINQRSEYIDPSNLNKVIKIIKRLLAIRPIANPFD